MTVVHLNLNNFNDFEQLLNLLPASDKYEFTAKKVFRLRERITCACGECMVHNGFDFVRKKGFGKAKIGKQLCKGCRAQYHEDKSFWKKLLADWQDTITSLILLLRDSHVAWDIIKKLMSFLIPCSKGKAMSLFNNRMEPYEYPQDNYLIVNYDEQHPKKGRIQQYRLTLLNYQTKVPIAEGLFDNKDEATIEAFLRTHLDVERELVIITDCDRRYPKIFKKLWGEKVIHQKCLLHLNKLVSKDFGKNMTLLNLYNKYLILDIFYNRKKELKFLERLLKKQHKQTFATNKEKQTWVKLARKKFYEYVKKLENQRRKNGKNLLQRPLWKAKKNFETLWEQQALFPKKAQERLRMIKNNWIYFTAFYAVKNCPATNNAIENYYSTSLKTHRKKQLRTTKGILNHMKLTALKREQPFSTPKKTLLEIYGKFKLITS